MPYLSVFWISRAIKKDPKIKVLECPENFTRLFSKYFWISGANNITGRCTRWAQPTWACQDPQARPGGLWSPRGPPHLLLLPTSLHSPRKNSLSLSLSRGWGYVSVAMCLISLSLSCSWFGTILMYRELCYYSWILCFSSRSSLL